MTLIPCTKCGNPEVRVNQTPISGFPDKFWYWICCPKCGLATDFELERKKTVIEWNSRKEWF